MDILTDKTTINANMTPAPYKSIAIRNLICVALVLNGESVISNLGYSDDILAAYNCIPSLNANVKTQNNCAIVKTSNAKVTGNFYCNESATLLRILIPIVSVLGGGKFYCKKSLLVRPMSEFENLFSEKKVYFNKTSEYIEVGGCFSHAGEYHMAGNLSSQYISGLLFALPLKKQDSKIILKTQLSSKLYVDITIETLKAFGVDILKTDYGYFVPGNQKYTSASVKNPPDWSLAGYFLALGVLAGSADICGLEFSSIQPDREIYYILQKMGADISFDNGVVCAKKSNLKPIDINADEFIDSAPLIAVLMLNAKGTSRIFGIERLKYKESNRIEAIVKLLNAVSDNACVFDGNAIIITGGGEFFANAEVSADNDHRIAMAACVLGALTKIKISGVECVNKSNPDFIKDYIKAGGCVEFLGE